MAYALDTNVIIHYLNHHPKVEENFNKSALEGKELIEKRRKKDI